MEKCGFICREDSVASHVVNVTITVDLVNKLKCLLCVNIGMVDNSFVMVRTWQFGLQAYSMMFKFADCLEQNCS